MHFGSSYLTIQSSAMQHWFLVFCFICSSLAAQEYAPFAKFNPAKKQEYIQEKQKLRLIENKQARSQAFIKLAYAYKDYEGLMVALEEEVKAHPQKAEMYYRLAGIQGIRSLEVSRIFAAPYLKGMIQNFEKALQLSPNYIPALEAYIEVLCKIPSFFGGSTTKAQEWAERLEKISPIDGAFAQALVVRETQGFAAALPKYNAVFRQMAASDFCMNPADFFQGKSINYPYKIAEMAVLTSSSPAVGLCAIDYFIDQASLYYNLPMEWVYYRKGQLLLRQGQAKNAKSMFKKALEINPKFEKAKKELF